MIDSAQGQVRAASVELLAGHGLSGVTVAIRQAGQHARRRTLGGMGPDRSKSQVCLLRQGLFSGAWDWRNKVFGSLLLLAENYIQQLRTKTQRHEGTKDAQRDLGAKHYSISS